MSYQRHVITGFTQVVHPHDNIDPDAVAAMTGHRVVLGESVGDDDVVGVVRRCEELA